MAELRRLRSGIGQPSDSAVARSVVGVFTCGLRGSKSSPS